MRATSFASQGVAEHLIIPPQPSARRFASREGSLSLWERVRVRGADIREAPFDGDRAPGLPLLGFVSGAFIAAVLWSGFVCSTWLWWR